MLAYAFWRELRKVTAAAPEIAAALSTALDLGGFTYMNWNMPSESFKKFRIRDMTHIPTRMARFRHCQCGPSTAKSKRASSGRRAPTPSACSTPSRCTRRYTRAEGRMKIHRRQVIASVNGDVESMSRSKLAVPPVP